MMNDIKKINLLKHLLIIEIILLILGLIFIMIFNKFINNLGIMELCKMITSTIFLCIMGTLIYLSQIKNTIDSDKTLEVSKPSILIKKLIVNFCVIGGFFLIIISNYTNIFSVDNQVLENFSKYGWTIGFFIFILGFIFLVIFFGKVSKNPQ